MLHETTTHPHLADRTPSAQATASRHRLGSAGTHAAVPATIAPFAAIARLRPLLVDAARLDMGDHPGGIRLRQAARATTAALATGGALPSHLVVGAGDPPAVVTRTIAAAWRHATASPR